MTAQTLSMPIDMTIAGLHRHYRNGDFSPQQLFARLLRQCRASSNPVWIHLLDEDQLAPWLDRLAGQSPDSMPLYGIPFAIKDNIDLAGVPTTAACPAFAYTPTESAFVVGQLLDAGAIPLGKTNLDQFATGLVGARSPAPWGPCHNAFNPDYISGGSSSGSALAVSLGWASFALGTDTAGSGRVPAAFNNIVGLKPTCGLLSTRGVVPACRSLDVVSIFALTAADANRVLDVAAVFDAADAYARQNPYHNGRRYFAPATGDFRVGIPQADQLQFFGDDDAAARFEKVLAQIEQAGGTPVAMDFTPFLAAARLLYEGPWLAERYLATLPLIESAPDELLPVIRDIIGPAGDASATACFRALYQLREHCQTARPLLDSVDLMLTPTAGTCYRLADVLSDPIRLNANLGYYTNFMNLMDYSALALPGGFLPSGVGFGFTLFHRAFADKQLLGFGARLQQELALPLGATGLPCPTEPSGASRPGSDRIKVVVCGAHLDGQPLNWQLRERGAQLLAATWSSPCYRLYALADGRRPAMVRVDNNGAAIAVEVWSMPAENFGSFTAEIPAPLGIGKVELADGSQASGFICDGYGLAGATDITDFGGWRPYLASKIG